MDCIVHGGRQESDTTERLSLSYNTCLFLTYFTLYNKSYTSLHITTSLQMKRFCSSLCLSNISLYIGVTGFPGGSLVQNLPIHAGDMDLIPGLGRSPGEGHGNPLQYSCLENPMDGGAWRAAVTKELDTI